MKVLDFLMVCSDWQQFLFIKRILRILVLKIDFDSNIERPKSLSRFC